MSRHDPAMLRAAARTVPADPHVALTAGRQLNRAAGMLAFSVLADSTLEHYRGTFHNPAMYAPLVSSALGVAASGHGVGDRRHGAHVLRDGAYAVAVLTGCAGLGFHFYNVAKRPGGFSWLNLFYSAPLGAPGALALSGLLGGLAERVRDNPPQAAPRVFGLTAGRTAAVLSSLGLLGTVAEVALLHFRGAFQDPFMILPLTVPPLAAGLLADTACSRHGPHRGLTRWMLHATAALGLAGVGFHTLGIARNMGGWRNWRQNVQSGPPLPAPPGFTGLALAGLAALGLLEDTSDG